MTMVVAEEKYESFLIGDMRTGLFLGQEPWKAPPDAFPTLVNAYTDKGVLRKRKGYLLFAKIGWNPIQLITQIVHEGYSEIIVVDTRQAYHLLSAGYQLTYISQNGYVWGVPLNYYTRKGLSLDPGGVARTYAPARTALPCFGHPFKVGDVIRIGGTTNYSSAYFTLQTGTSQTELVINKSKVTETFDGSETVVRRQTMLGGIGRMCQDRNGNIYQGGTGFAIRILKTDGSIVDNFFIPPGGCPGIYFDVITGLKISKDGEHLYVATNLNGISGYMQFYKFRLSDGAQIWTQRVGNTVSYNIDIDANDNVYIQTQFQTDPPLVNRIMKVAASDGTVSSIYLFNDQQGLPYDVHVDDSLGKVIIGGYQLRNPPAGDLFPINIVICDLDGGDPHTLALGGLYVESGVTRTETIGTGCITSYKGYIYVILYSHTLSKDQVYKLDSDLNIIAQVDGPPSGRGIFVDFLGHIVVVNQDYGDAFGTGGETDVFWFYDADLNFISAADNFYRDMLDLWDAPAGGSYQKGNVEFYPGIFQTEIETIENWTLTTVYPMSSYSITNITLGVDKFTGGEDDYFWYQEYRGRLYMCNGVDPIYYHTPNYTPPYTILPMDTGAVVIETCRMLFQYKNRLLIVSPKIGGVWYPQHVYYTDVNLDNVGVNNWFKAPTDDTPVTGGYIDEVPVIFFRSSIWHIVYTGNTDAPYTWQRRTCDFGAAARMGTAVIKESLATIGLNRLLSYDRYQPREYDLSARGILDQMSATKVVNSFAHTFKDREFMGICFTRVGQSDHDRILLYNYQEDSFHISTIPAHCLFSINGPWLPDGVSPGNFYFPIRDQDYRKYEFAGTKDGRILWLHQGYLDDGVNITTDIRSGQFNPFQKEGLRAKFGWLKILISAAVGEGLEVSLYKDHSDTAFKTIQVWSNGTTNHWKTIWADGEVADFFRVKIVHIYQAGVLGGDFAIHGFLLGMKRAGKIGH